MIEMLEQDICNGCQKVTGVRYFAREDVWHCEGCQEYDLDAALTPCPNHEGAYDCTPFCELCEGEQEVVVTA
jgi:ribosomal protein L37AE/L43A